MRRLLKKKYPDNTEETFTYDPVGNRLTGPKDKLNYTYNTANQLTDLTKLSPHSEGGDGGVVSSTSSSPHREEGWGEGDSPDSVVRSFSFAEEKKSQYTYDKNGNLTKKIEYDDDGNIKTITLYTYDFENRLTRVEMQRDGRENIVEFTYDPFGRRLSKIIHRHEIDDDDEKDVILSLSKDDEDHPHPRATYYVYDNENIILEYNHKSRVTVRYVHGQGIDEPLAVEQKGKGYYYHADGLGSIVALTNGKGGIIQTYDYDSFGNPKKHGSKVKQPYTYTGREWDRETGLYYYRVRYYDPTIGRFTGFDPILHPAIGPPQCCGCGQVKNISIPSFDSLKENPQKLNPFIYVGNNPINRIDPTGLVWYGNWCGPGGSGTPINCYDRACKKHDECYAKCGVDAKTRWYPSNILSGCAWECDKQLARDWKNCACSK